MDDKDHQNLIGSEEYFTRNYRGKDLSRERPDPALTQVLADAPIDLRGASVLEIGCGAARNLLWLHDEFECECTGVEPSDQVVGQLNESLDHLNFAQAWSYELPFETDSFDAILIYGVLSVVERNRVLQSMGEAMRVARRWLIIGEYVAHQPFRMQFKHQEDHFCYHTDFEPVFQNTGVIECRFRQTVVHEQTTSGPRTRLIGPADESSELDRFKTCIFEKTVASTPVKTFKDFARRVA